MTTNTEHRRRETDKIDQVCIKYQLEKANARIAELEKLLWRARTFIINDVIIASNDRERLSIMQDTLFALPPQPAEKQGEPTACRICHGSLDKHGTCIDPECIPY